MDCRDNGSNPRISLPGNKHPIPLSCRCETMTQNACDMYFECLSLNEEITGKRHPSCALSECRSGKGDEEEDVLTLCFPELHCDSPSLPSMSPLPGLHGRLGRATGGR